MSFNLPRRSFNKIPAPRTSERTQVRGDGTGDRQDPASVVVEHFLKAREEKKKIGHFPDFHLDFPSPECVPKKRLGKRLGR